MKNIIVPVDYSEASLNAASYAAALAEHSNARIILFHAFPLSIPTSGMTFLFPDIDNIILEHKIKLNKIATDLCKNHGVLVKCISRPTYVLDELPLLVKQFNADLVVMGMRGISLDYKIFGSITISVIREAKFPVLVIPANVQFKPIKKILFACEYSCLTVTNKLSILQKISRRFDSDIQVLHVEKFRTVATVGAPADLNKGIEIESLLVDIQHEYKYLDAENVVQGIETGIKEFKPQMVAMVPHKLTFWEEIFNKGNTDKIAFKSNIPLLSIPNP